jgi:hypothetical protein
MSTPLREATLNAWNEPNEVAKRVQNAFRDNGCPVLIKSGARKGQQCGGRVLFEAPEGWCHCMKVRGHGDEAYSDPFGKFIWDVINAIPEEDMKAMRETEAEGHDERAAVEAEKQRLASAAVSEKRSKSAAAKEAIILGLEVGDFHHRPEGRAPDGMTWSYRLGEWVDPERITKDRRDAQKG